MAAKSNSRSPRRAEVMAEMDALPFVVFDHYEKGLRMGRHKYSCESFMSERPCSCSAQTVDTPR